jgi:hypothetical protein
MHFYIIDGNFYLGRWLYMPPTWQVPSSLSDLCMDSIIIPNFQNQAAGAVFAVLPLFFLFQDAEGFTEEIMAINILRIENITQFIASS